ncbi:MAG: LytR/AlgR family response regulator transcription factor [Flavobacteriales bacterium]
MALSESDFRIVIVEDDPLIAQDIKEILTFVQYKVVGVFNSPEAFRNSSLEGFDLAILDINLNANESGIDIAYFIKEKYKANHIFITSYFDQNTIEKAGRSMALSYLLKPYNANEILANVQLAVQKIQFQNQLRSNSVFLKTSLGLKSVDLSNVLYIEAIDVYSKVFLTNERITTSHSLKQLEEQLPSSSFIRLHKSFIVNMDCIDLIKDNEVRIKEFAIPIGRAYRKSFFDALRIH